MNTLYEIYQNAVKNYSDDLFFLKSKEDGISYSQMDILVKKYLTFFSSSGLNPGDHIVFTLVLDIESICALVAIYISKLICVPLYPETTDSTAGHIIKQVDAVGFLYDSNIECRFNIGKVKQKVLNSLDIREIDINRVNYNEKKANYLMRQECDDAMNLSTIIFSSGSTGFPKGIMISSKNLALGAEIVSQYTRLTKDDIILSPLRPNFDYGLNQIWQTMLIGAKLANADMRQPHLFYKKINDISPTVIPLMPAIIKILRSPLLERIKKKYNLSNVRLACSSGGKLSESDLDWLENTFVNAWICPMYGLTEAFRSTYLPEEFYGKKRSSIGIAIPGCEIKIIDENDQELPPGQIGELVHLGGCISEGYLKLPEKTLEKFAPLKILPNEKCVRSGDLAFKDKDGFIYFVGRNDEMIKSNGIRVSPTEIETELSNCTGVMDSMAFGVADLEESSSKIYCCITVNDEFDDDIFVQEIKNNMPSHLRPSAYLIMSEFPLTGNGGKINRPSIKNLCIESKETKAI